MTQNDINGFGVRLNKVELSVAGMEAKVERNEKDIQTIFTALDELPKSNQKMLNGFLVKVAVIMSIPTVAVLAVLLVN